MNFCHCRPRLSKGPSRRLPAAWESSRAGTGEAGASLAGHCLAAVAESQWTGVVGQTAEAPLWKPWGQNCVLLISGFLASASTESSSDPAKVAVSS